MTKKEKKKITKVVEKTSKPSKTSKVLAAFANIKLWSKKKKVIAICIAVFLILAIVGGTVAGVLLTRKAAGPSEIVTQSYYYAIANNNNKGIKIVDSWRQGLDLSEFKLTSDSSKKVALDNDNTLTIVGTAEIWSQHTLKYNYKDKTAVEIKVTIAANVININSLAELKAIPANATGIYILGGDIDVVGSVSIKNFGGTFYGNHHTISNLNVSTVGGLFDSVNNGYVYSVNLSKVTGSINNVDGGNYGALANSAFSSDFYYCKAEGKFSINFVPSAEDVNNLTLCVGGMFGFLDDNERKSDIDTNVNAVKFCRSNIAITAETNGKIYLGGIAGKVLNASITASISNGAINAQLNHSPLAYIGGVAGQIEKTIKEYGKLIHSYDLGGNLFSYGDITVNSIGAHSLYKMYVGGVIGSVINHNLTGLNNTAKIKITAEENIIYVAQIIAFVKNAGTQGIIIPMEINNMAANGTVDASVKSGTKPIYYTYVAENSGVTVNTPK